MYQGQDKGQGKRGLLVAISLPMLGLLSAWGVYEMNLLFVPQWVAILSASAFEVTTIGLSLLRLQYRDQNRAMIIALVACFVSVLYNSLSGYFRLQDIDLKSLTWQWSAVLAVIHGLPLPSLGLAVAWLLLHRQPDTTIVEASPIPSRHNPPVTTKEDKLLKASPIPSRQSIHNPPVTTKEDKLLTGYSCFNCQHILTSSVSQALSEKNAYCKYCDTDPQRIAKRARKEARLQSR